MLWVRGGFRIPRRPAISFVALMPSSGVEFVFGIDAHPSFVRRAKALPEQAWGRFEREIERRASRR